MNGCATPSPPQTRTHSPLPYAQLDLVNLSVCAWRITLNSTDGREPIIALVPVDGNRSLTFPAGDYVLTQTALTGLSSAAAERRFPAHFDSGEPYHWPLVTLLTGAVTSHP